MNNETDTLKKYADLVKEANERGLNLKYRTDCGGIFYLNRNDSTIARNLKDLNSVENFLKGYQEGYEGCIEDYEFYSLEDGSFGLYEHDFTE